MNQHHIDNKIQKLDHSYRNHVFWHVLKKENLIKINQRYRNKVMNIVKTEAQFLIEAKTSGYSEKKSISYYFIEFVHSLCLDKIEIILEQIPAYERLLKYAKDETDKAIIEKENIELKFALDLINF
jgi:hypothetical protein